MQEVPSSNLGGPTKLSKHLQTLAHQRLAAPVCVLQGMAESFAPQARLHLSATLQESRTGCSVCPQQGTLGRFGMPRNRSSAAPARDHPRRVRPCFQFLMVVGWNPNVAANGDWLSPSCLHTSRISAVGTSNNEISDLFFVTRDCAASDAQMSRRNHEGTLVFF